MLQAFSRLLTLSELALRAVGVAAPDTTMWPSKQIQERNEKREDLEACGM